MLDLIELPGGVVLSVKTFRPLWVFPWTSAVWRQAPFRTAIGTVAYKGRSEAKQAHKELAVMLKTLELSPDMSNLFTAVESFAQQRTSQGVKSYRVCAGHEVEGRVSIKVQPPEEDG